MKKKLNLLALFVSFALFSFALCVPEAEDPSIDNDEIARLRVITDKLNAPKQTVVDHWDDKLGMVSERRLAAITHKQDDILTKLRKMDELRAQLIGRFHFLVENRKTVRNHVANTHLNAVKMSSVEYIHSEKSCFGMLRHLLKDKLFMSYSEWKTMYGTYLKDCRKTRPSYIYVVNHHHHHHHFLVSRVSYEALPVPKATVEHGWAEGKDIIGDDDSGNVEEELPKTLSARVHPSYIPGYFGAGYHAFNILNPSFNPYYLPPIINMAPSAHMLAEYRHYMKCNKKHYELKNERDSADYKENYDRWLEVCHPDEHIKRIHEKVLQYHKRIIRAKHHLQHVTEEIEKHKMEMDILKNQRENTSEHQLIEAIYKAMQIKKEGAARLSHCGKIKYRLTKLRKTKLWPRAYKKFTEYCPERQFIIKQPKPLQQEIKKLEKEDKLENKLGREKSKEAKVAAELKKITKKKKKVDMKKYYAAMLRSSKQRVESVQRFLAENKSKTKDILSRIEEISAKHARGLNENKEMMKAHKFNKDGMPVEILGKPVQKHMDPDDFKLPPPKEEEKVKRLLPHVDITHPDLLPTSTHRDPYDLDWWKKSIEEITKASEEKKSDEEKPEQEEKPVAEKKSKNTVTILPAKLQGLPIGEWCHAAQVYLTRNAAGADANNLVELSQKIDIKCKH